MRSKTEYRYIKEKPFICIRCQRAFGRKDVLLRHQKLHEASNAIESTDVPPALDSAVNGEPNFPDSESSPQRSPSLENIFAMEHHANSNLTLPYADSDYLLDTLLSDFNSSWPVPLPVLQFQSTNSPFVTTVEEQLRQDPTGPGHQAMDQMSRLITELSSSLTAEIHSKGITSGFLDSCMHAFFNRFVPSFPFLHKATFNVRDSSYPLLLNIVALGSLFVGAQDAIPKGESLWRLAHTAVATSWAKLMATRGARDKVDGVQLVLTALTGQTYAILSRNESLRATAQIFHGLGFYWARKCGMYATEVQAIIPSLAAPEAEKLEAWKGWAADEVQKRAVLSHYILDGHISQFSGYPSCASHVANPLLVSGPDEAFMADNADDWIRAMANQKDYQPSFREIFLSLFSSTTSPMSSASISFFSTRVVLEGFQSLVSGMQEAKGPVVGSLPSTAVAQALIRLLEDHIISGKTHSIEHTELLIRWHAICIELATPCARLCGGICAVQGIEQQLYDGINQADHGLDLRQWSQTTDARRSLLHAMAIQEISDKLPLGRSHIIHLPAALFSACTVYSAHCLAGVSNVAIPKRYNWRDVWRNHQTENEPNSPFLAYDNDVESFMHGQLTPNSAGSVMRNLTYDLSTLQLTTNSICRWGVTHEMEKILQLWISATNEGFTIP